MKTLLKTLPLGLFAFLTLFIVSCNNDDDDNNGGTPPMNELSIYETAVASPDLTILVAALEQTGLDETLDAAGTYTVFAPTDDAFEAAGISAADLPGISNDVLTNLLLNHVLGTEVLSSQLSTTYVNTLATGPDDNNISLFINTSGGVEFNGVASPISSGLDISASNGVVHLIDAPLTIPTVVDHAIANPNFSTLVSVITGLGDELPDLSEGGPYTVFAPTNAAFEDLFDLLGTTDINPAVLKAVVLYHVAVGANVQSGQLSDGQELAMGVDGEKLTVDLSDGPKLVDGTGREINIVATNVQGSNGVVHAVDQVLLPPSIVEALLADATIYQIAKLAKNYSSLAAAIERAGLVDALNDPMAELTVFAPDNDAFDTFLGELSVEDVDADVLKNIILNHALSGAIFAEDVVMLGTNYYKSLATNADGDNLSFYVNVGDPIKINGVSTITSTDLEASNGVIHGVDAVIGLPTVVTFATADPNFETLEVALKTVEDEAGYIATLETPWGTSPAPFTVLAPDNDAFADLLAELGVSELGEIPSETVIATLAMHVVGEANVRAEDLMDGIVTTLGGDITLTTENDAIFTDANGRSATVTAFNVQAINGVIHAIDRVLLPDLNAGN